MDQYYEPRIILSDRTLVTALAAVFGVDTKTCFVQSVKLMTHAEKAVAVEIILLPTPSQMKAYGRRMTYA